MKNLAWIVVAAFVLLLLRSSVSAQDTSAGTFKLAAHTGRKSTLTSTSSSRATQTTCIRRACAWAIRRPEWTEWTIRGAGSLRMEPLPYSRSRGRHQLYVGCDTRFYTYVDANPLANGKPAWSVLQSVLRTNGPSHRCATSSKAEPQASALTDECKTRGKQCD